MHDAYEANILLKLGVQIESMTAYGNYLTKFVNLVKSKLKLIIQCFR